MYLKHRHVIALATLTLIAAPFGIANATTATTIVPLMPTRDPLAHQNPMQSYLSTSMLPSIAGAESLIMTPLMQTKDLTAHEGRMQGFPWTKPYTGRHRPAHAVINIDPPLMVTKDPLAHEGDMEDYL